MSSASDLFAFPPAVDQGAGTPSGAPVGLRQKGIFEPRQTAETGGGRRQAAWTMNSSTISGYP